MDTFDKIESWLRRIEKRVPREQREYAEKALKTLAELRRQFSLPPEKRSASVLGLSIALDEFILKALGEY